MPFIQGICAQENIPGFPKLWVDLVQEEIKLKSCLEKQGELDSIGLIREDEEG
jgi:hypothetical protein